MSILWDEATKEKFTQMLAKVPAPLQEFAKGKITQKAEQLAQDGSRSEVTEKDLVDALFAETPFGFHGPMKTDMQAVGIDYVRYGYDA